jgi:hypothetical protein
MDTAEYDPFARGHFPVGERIIQAPDLTRPCGGRTPRSGSWPVASSPSSPRAESRRSRTGHDSRAPHPLHPLPRGTLDDAATYARDW